MRYIATFLLVTLSMTFQVLSQSPIENTFVKDMEWNAESRIHMTLFNDSSYDINVADLTHSSTIEKDSTDRTFIYYPVMLARDFVGEIQGYCQHHRKFLL